MDMKLLLYTEEPIACAIFQIGQFFTLLCRILPENRTICIIEKIFYVKYDLVYA
jgi:hypothetical protein